MVLCFVLSGKPKTTSNVPEDPKLYFKTEPASVVIGFEVLPQPTVTTSDVRFHGEGRNVSQAVSSDITLQVNCVSGDVAYLMTCNVTVSDLKSREAQGFYSLHVENLLGSADAYFQVVYGGE